MLGAGTYWLCWQSDSEARVASRTAAALDAGFSAHVPFGSVPATLPQASCGPLAEVYTESLTYTVDLNPAAWLCR